jgi:hypothetical protein
VRRADKASLKKTVIGSPTSLSKRGFLDESSMQISALMTIRGKFELSDGSGSRA